MCHESLFKLIFFSKELFPNCIPEDPLTPLTLFPSPTPFKDRSPSFFPVKLNLISVRTLTVSLGYFSQSYASQQSFN
jgi:hypothetical protein